MASLLLAIIYLCFISLGLPDSLLGSAWPSISQSLNVPISLQGIISFITCAGTIVASLFSDKILRKIKSQYLITISIFLTASAMIGFAFANKFWLLCILAIPYGLGAGAIDSTLNNYVALNYSARHMSWLHCFWGIGTLAGPYLISYGISIQKGYAFGYEIVSIIQFAILAIVIFTLPIWNKTKFDNKNINEENMRQLTFKEKFKIKGIVFVLIGFFAYCSIEAVAMNWASTYLYKYRMISEENAAAFGSLFFIGITVGRFISGIFANKIGDKKMIRIGIAIITLGIILIALPVHEIVCYCGLVILGLGCGPIYPAIIHSTPINFGKENSQAIIGLEMACAYIGYLLMGPLFGIIADYINIGFYPLYIGIFLIILIVMTETLNFKIKKRKIITN